MKHLRIVTIVLISVSLYACSKEATAKRKLEKMHIEYTPASFIEQIKANNSIAVDLFLIAGINPNLKDHNGYSILMFAIEKGFSGIAKQLVDKGADVNTKTSQGDSALIIATEKGFSEIVKLLVEKGADVNTQTSSYPHRLSTPLIIASEKGYVDIVKTLIEKGANVNAKDNNERTALIEAAWNGHVDIVKTLIEKGADVNTKDMEGNTALILSSLNGHVKIVQALLDKGADVLSKGSRYTALRCAIEAKSPEIVKLLLEKGANPNEKYDDGLTPLRLAVIEGVDDVVDILLAKGVNSDDLNQADRYLYKRAKENFDSENLYGSKEFLDKLLTRFPNSAYKAQATGLLKAVNSKLSIADAVEKGESEISSAISSQESGKAWATLRTIKKYISEDRYNELAKGIDKEQNKPIYIALRDLLAEQDKYNGRRVKIGPSNVWIAYVSTKSFEVERENENIVIDYEKMPNQEQLRRIDRGQQINYVVGIFKKGYMWGGTYVDPHIDAEEINY